MGNAETKLREAEFFLNQMRSHTGGNQEFMFKLSACLTAIRSVMDVLLYDYGVQYSLCTLNDKIHPSDFERLAAERSHAEAAGFYRWWAAKLTSLAADPTAGFLFEQRHILVHRGIPEMVWSLFFAETLSISASLAIDEQSRPAGPAPPGAFDVKAVPGPAASTPSPPVFTPAVPIPRPPTTGHFADRPGEDVIDLCQQCLTMLSNIVVEARTTFR